MAYSPIAYTTTADVYRLLRTQNNKIRIGTEPGQISEPDVEAYILEAGMHIDSFIRAAATFDAVPVTTYTEKPEITFAAPRLASFYIYRSMYPSYRQEQLGAGVNGWREEAMGMLDMLKKHIDLGVYTDLSPAAGGLQFITAQQFFQTKIGVAAIHDLIGDRINQVPTKTGNIGPYASESN